MASMVIVLIGDIVQSRSLTGRDAINARLHSAISSINHNRSGLLSPYTHTIGDEIQAVFAESNGIFADAFQVLAALYPVQMRFFFGVGSLSTKINPERAIGMDGPAFHLARTGIESLKREGSLFGVEFDSKQNCSGIQAALDLVSFHIKGWKSTRLKTFALHLRGLKVKEIAVQLGVSDKTVYKTISAGGLGIIHRILENTEREIRTYLQEEI